MRHLHTHALLILCLLCPLSLYSQSYYVSNDGDNNNVGSELLPWKDISEVNDFDYLPGDNIFFKRGHTFRGNINIRRNGSAGNYIRYGAYGTGAKPKILGSVARNDSSDWSDQGGNIWKTASSTLDVGNIIFDNENSVGFKRAALGDLQSNGDFYYDPSTPATFLYATANPATFYSSIELALDKDLIGEWKNSYLIYENLDLRYTGAHGIAGELLNNIIIRNIDMSYIGGSYQVGILRYGNGIEFWENGHDNLVEGCTISQTYDDAITCQGTNDGYDIRNIMIRNNIIDRCEQGFEFWVRGAGSTADNIQFINNTCRKVGYGWSHGQRDDPNGCFLLFWGSNDAFSNIIIRNNIFDDARDYGIFDTRSDFSSLDNSKVTISDNSWNVNVILVAVTNWIGDDFVTTSYDWDYYRNTLGQGAQSINGDPLLNSDYTLTANSPCVDAGATLSEVTNDIIGSARPQGGSYDIGAYELLVLKRSLSILLMKNGTAMDGDASLDNSTWSALDSNGKISFNELDIDSQHSVYFQNGLNN